MRLRCSNDESDHAALVGLLRVFAGLVGCVVAAVTTELTRWMMGDPAKVCERLQAQEIAFDRRAINMGQKLKSVPEHIQRDMHQWAEWASREQFWANLSITPFCRLMGMHFGGKEPNIRLDPQSMAIHKAVMSLDDKYKIVVFAYYVAKVWHEDNPELFNCRGISRATYYRRLAAGVAIAHKRAMRILESVKINL